MASKALVFACAVSKVQTLADGGLRVTLDLPEDATAAAKQLMDWRGEYMRATLEIVPTMRATTGDIPHAVLDG